MSLAYVETGENPSSTSAGISTSVRRESIEAISRSDHSANLQDGGRFRSAVKSSSDDSSSTYVEIQLRLVASHRTLIINPEFVGRSLISYG